MKGLDVLQKAQAHHTVLVMATDGELWPVVVCRSGCRLTKAMWRHLIDLTGLCVAVTWDLQWLDRIEPLPARRPIEQPST